jgi:hypothetical protein
MPAVIGSSYAARIAGLARQKVMERKVLAGRNPRPLVNFADARKRSTQFTGGGVMTPIKEPAFNINAQEWSGAVTLQNPTQIQNMLMAEFKPSNMFSNFYWPYDDLRKVSGVTILPNQNGAQTGDARAVSRDTNSERVLYDRLTSDMESFEDRVNQLRDLAIHRPGTSSADALPGVLALLPIGNTGKFGGLDRESVQAVQHVVFAGGITPQAGIPWIDAAGTTGGSGTLLTQLEKFIRVLRNAAFTCGLPKGRWKLFGGSGFFDKLKAQCRLEKVAFNIDAGSSTSKLNLLLPDERIGLSADDMDLQLDYTLDQLDTEFSSEIGLAPSVVTATFAGGTVGAADFRLPKGYVVLPASGAMTPGVAKLVITDPGQSLAGTAGTGTTALTVTFSAPSSGSGHSATVKYFSATANANTTTADADDVRIGRMDGTATVFVAGTSVFPMTSTAAPATNRLYALYEPAWEYLVQEGLDNFMSIPADNPRNRQLEQQWDHTHSLINCAPRCSGVFVAA